MEYIYEAIAGLCVGCNMRVEHAGSFYVTHIGIHALTLYLLGQLTLK